MQAWKKLNPSFIHFWEQRFYCCSNQGIIDYILHSQNKRKYVYLVLLDTSVFQIAFTIYEVKKYAFIFFSFWLYIGIYHKLED